MEFTLAQSTHQEPQFCKLPIARRSAQCLILGQELVSVELTSQNRSSEGKLGVVVSLPQPYGIKTLSSRARRLNWIVNR